MMPATEVEKPENATLVVRRLLKATPALVFETWTNLKHIKHWMKPEPGMEIGHVLMDLRLGGKFRIQMIMPDGDCCTAVGEFTEVTPPRRLVYTWDWEKDGSGTEFGEVEGKTTLVTIDFIERGEQTEFVLTHTRFATVESRDSHAGGWSRIVESLANFTESK